MLLWHGMIFTYRPLTYAFNLINISKTYAQCLILYLCTRMAENSYFISPLITKNETEATKHLQNDNRLEKRGK